MTETTGQFLTKVQRLKLLTALGTHFSAQSYPLIDAALSAFEIPTLNSWSGDQHSYVLHLLQKHASDDDLIQLGEYAGVTDGMPSSPSSTSEHTGSFRSFRLFITHLSKHHALASEIRTKLLTYGIHSFVAHVDIKPTVEWLTEIERRLTRCDALLALLHDGFKESDWTDQEIGWVRGGGRPVFAVRFDLAPYGFFGHVQAFSGKNKPAAEIATELFESLATNAATRAQISYAAVNRFCESDTFAHAKRRVEHLFKLKFWNEELLARLKAQSEENGQIKHSFGVPERVATLLASQSVATGNTSS